MSLENEPATNKFNSVRSVALVQGYLAHKKTPIPEDHRRALGIGLL